MGTTPRTRDVTTFFVGDRYTVNIAPSLIASGWTGGTGVKWSDSGTSDKFMVELSDGLYGGFLLWGSSESSDSLVSMTENQLTYSFGTLCAGGWLMSTVSYEKYTWASRQVGPLVQNTYTPGQSLYFSLRGLWTGSDEWTESGDPRAPNYFAVGRVVQPPSAINNYNLTLQTSI